MLWQGEKQRYEAGGQDGEKGNGNERRKDGERGRERVKLADGHIKLLKFVER